MLLAIDIGNTNIVLGLFRERELLHHWRVGTRRDGTADEYGILLKSLFEVVGIHPSAVSGVIIASVVPPLQPVFEELTSAHFRVAPVVVGPGIRTGMPILYDNPREVGADRIVNAVAAYETYGGPAIVVDFGTATTFDAISAKGEYLGGGIVRRMVQEMEREPAVIGTGGLAHLILTESETVQHIDAFLTLKGLQIVYDRNR